MTFCRVADLCVSPETTIRAAMERINQTLRSIALVVDSDTRLLGTITDGDIRRAILAKGQLDESVATLLRARGSLAAVTAPVGTESAQLLKLMLDQKVLQVPLLDEEGRVVDLVTQNDLLPTAVAPLGALIMAGGMGVRLRPLTADLPKPMLPVGGRPLMELTVERLRRAGIQSVHVATHYKSEKIVDHFGDGADFGVDVKYLTEDRPMGTAGALSLLPETDQTILVINGDILTDVDFKAMRAFHVEHGAALTVAVRKYAVNVPYGVVEPDGPFVRSLKEKPVVNFFVNAGIYLFEPLSLAFARKAPMDMPELISGLLAAGEVVVNFPVLEYWMDIGQHTDYLQAQEDVKQMRCDG